MNLADYPHWVTPDSTELCVAPGCRRQLGPDDPPGTLPGPRFSVAGSQLCNWHHARFPRLLLDLSGLWTDLEGALHRRSSAVENTRVQTSNVRDMAQVWNPHATEVMSDLSDWTGFLVRTVLRERPLPPAETTTYDRTETLWVNGRKHVLSTPVDHITEHTHGLRTDTPTRLALAALAKHHAHWLSHYPTLGAALLQDGLDARYKALQAIQAAPVRRVGLSKAICGHVIDTMGAHELTCHAPMVAILRADDRVSVIVCAAHPKTHPQYTKDEWMAWAE